MCLALSKLPKESNSVSSQAKMMLSLHVCIKNVEFYKYKIVFFWILYACAYQLYSGFRFDS